MDGNRRWSLKANTSSFNAYYKGANNLLKISKYCFEKYPYLKNLSAFALSTNNMKREKRGISIIKSVITKILNENSFDRKVNFIIEIKGDTKFLGVKLNNQINNLNSNNENIKKLTIFINYGGQEDIIAAVNKIKNYKNKIDIDRFKKYLITSNMPDPDILIRTGGFKRISNFNLFQISFTELFFLKKLWPDFSNNDLDKIVNKYFKIDRKFGI